MLHSQIGTLTYLLTDLEGSTRMWEEHPDAMAIAIRRHEEIIAACVAASGGAHISEQGEGDSTLSVFKNATHAVQAACAIRAALAKEPWPAGLILRVRIGLHSGVADLRAETYHGRVVNRAARVRGAAHGGQILFTRATRELLDPREIGAVKDHGRHRLKDLLEPEHLFEIPAVEDCPPPRSLNYRPHNLPVQLTSFVGRQSDLTAVGEMLTRSRIVTILGVGGMGKTRLALQVAADSLDQFPDGVFLVELLGLADPDEMERAILAATKVDRLDTLATRQILLVLDNCEQAASTIGTLAKRILSLAPDLRIVATSRGILKARGELVHRLAPMSLPSERAFDDPNAVAQSEAVQLLVERVGARSPGFTVTPDNCAPLARLVRKLDGIALALELAAPKLAILSANQLCSRLDHRFQILKSADSTEAARHQTLQATIDHSYELLSADEQAVLRRMSVFAGGWTLDSAEAILPARLKGSTLELMEGLFDKSLIQKSEGSAEPRFFLLEAIREYAMDRLDREGETDDAHSALVVWALRRFQGETAGEELLNLNGVLEWAVTAGRADLGLQLVFAGWTEWRRAGRLSVGRRWITEFLGAASSDDDRGRAHAILGSFDWYLADFEGATAAFESALSYYQAAGNQAKITASTNNLGLLAIMASNYDEARVRFEDARRGFLRLADFLNFALASSNLGMAELYAGNLDAARLHQEAALSLEDRIPEMPVLYGNLAQTEFVIGDFEATRVALGRCADVMSRRGLDQLTLTQALMVAAGITAEDGDSGLAARLLGAERESRKVTGEPLSALGATILARAREKIEADANFASQFTIGATLSPEDALALLATLFPPESSSD